MCIRYLNLNSLLVTRQMTFGKTLVITINTFLTISVIDALISDDLLALWAPMITTAVVFGRKPEYSDDSNICSNVSDDSTGGIN